MISTAVLITLCILLLLAYTFDISSAKTKIPSVILLLVLGWIVRQFTGFFKITVPNLNGILPALGSIGLILIVLEGALELEFNRSKIAVIKKSFAVSFIPVMVLSFAVASAFSYFGDFPFKISLVNAIPFCVISSAIAIPSARYLSPGNREFVVYESSFSDIIGVVFFDFMVLNKTINTGSFTLFILQLLAMLIIAFVASIALAFLLSKIDHHIKFAPIIIAVILVYEVSKIYHLPSLIFILVLGLFLGNLDELKTFKWIQKLRPQVLNREVHKFKEITIEATFLVKALFFLLFGYLMETNEILNANTIIWAIGIVASIFIIRAIHLKFFKLKLAPLLFIAPRGLITILLFLAIPLSQSISLVNNALVVQVVILSSLVMMIGLLVFREADNKK